MEQLRLELTSGGLDTICRGSIEVDYGMQYRSVFNFGVNGRVFNYYPVGANISVGNYLGLNGTTGVGQTQISLQTNGNANMYFMIPLTSTPWNSPLFRPTAYAFIVGSVSYETNLFGPNSTGCNYNSEFRFGVTTPLPDLVDMFENLK